MKLALFPLQTVLFPQGLLPLQVFEPRYLDMIRRCERERQPFAVVTLQEGQEVQQPDPQGLQNYASERFHPLGTLAHVEAVTQPQAGLLRVVCRGGQRVRIQHAEKGPLGLWLAESEGLDDDHPVAVPTELLYISDTLFQVHAQMTQDHPHWQDSGAPSDPEAPQWQDAGWVANRWAEILPLPLDMRVRLLGLESPLLRLELIGDQLDQLGLR